MVVPRGAFVRLAVTSWKFSQPPVTGTVAVPSRRPVGEPARTSSLPPVPPEAMRAVIFVALLRTYGSKEIQSLLLMSPTVLPPCAVAFVWIVTPSDLP